MEIDLKLLEKIKKTNDYWSVVSEYLKTIDELCKQTYVRNFSAATLEQRTKIISAILMNDSEQELLSIVKTLKNQTLGYFYTTQSAFDMLSYHPPSQGDIQIMIERYKSI